MSTEIEILKKQILIITKLIKIYQMLLREIFKKKVDVILHHTATDRDRTSFEAINRGHKNRRRNGKRVFSQSSLGFHCAYNCLITGDGEEHWARSLDESGEGTSAFKGFHIDLCATGNFMTEALSEAQILTLTRVLKRIEEKCGIKSIKGHRNYYATLCPGKNLYKWMLNYRKVE